ncbi:hypothetical protein CHS0354_042904 [Potamilus streckersoni]|uniref:SAM domain-containing protein n=1 Tax=Potamilus streckersoni TaxID=2493646 RepID=A0AAE0T513_9BIVA|nr:hypothetical protein CHS0354_042904 [Potamilus streckersoni]
MTGASVRSSFTLSNMLTEVDGGYDDLSNENYCAMTEGVRNFLDGLGLVEHYDMFVAKGFDSEEDISHLCPEDLDLMFINDEAQRKLIIEASRRFQPSKEYRLYEWLREKGLDHYFINFVRSELTDFTTISRLNLPDEGLYDELEITMPGHKKRLERAVRHLVKHQKTAQKQAIESSSSEAGSDVEQPVAYGRWGKPQYLQEAKYDFLVIEATIASTVEVDQRHTIEFMVDSGSDVVTVRQELLDSMDLELIGPIQSRGVHASRRKNLYKAKMIIGEQELEIEVMGESYDSIGSRVIRHFRHYISGRQHIWLRGDYVDPSMIPRLFSSPSSPTTSTNSASPDERELTSELLPSSEDTFASQSTVTSSFVSSQKTSPSTQSSISSQRSGTTLSSGPSVSQPSGVSHYIVTSQQHSAWHETDQTSQKYCNQSERHEDFSDSAAKPSDGIQNDILPGESVSQSELSVEDILLGKLKIKDNHFSQTAKQDTSKSWITSSALSIHHMTRKFENKTSSSSMVDTIYAISKAMPPYETVSLGRVLSAHRLMENTAHECLRNNEHTVNSSKERVKGNHKNGKIWATIKRKRVN